MPYPDKNVNLYDFRKIIGDYSRPHLFLIEIPAIGGDPVELSCFARTTELPAYKVNSTDIDFQGVKYKVATTADFGGTINFEFLVDDAHEIRLRFLQWASSIYDIQRGVAGSPLFYKADNIKISQLNRVGKIVFQYNLIGAFPTNVGNISLSHGETTPEKFQVEFTYDYFAASNATVANAVDSSIPFVGAGNAITGLTTNSPFGGGG